ncbi:MAG: RHS repeat-associated core domain-containing protein [Gemmatimonadaceae bacterium]
MTAVLGDLPKSGATAYQKLSYDAWGKVEQTTGGLFASDTNRLRWKGLVWEGDSTQLYYMRARWYDPLQRRFVSEDPIGLDGGINMYTFVGNDAVNERDPAGLGGDVVTCTVSVGNQAVGTLPGSCSDYSDDVGKCQGAGNVADCVATTVSGILTGLADALAGVLDFTTFGLSTYGMNAAGGHINTNSPSFQAGYAVGFALSFSYGRGEASSALAAAKAAAPFLREFFKKNSLQAILEGRMYIPRGLTREHLLAYREVIFDYFNRKTVRPGGRATQEERWSIVDEALKRFR